MAVQPFVDRAVQRNLAKALEIARARARAADDAAADDERAPADRAGRRAATSASFTWGFAQVAGRVIGTDPPNLFLTLGRHRRLFRGWLRFAGRLMPRRQAAAARDRAGDPPRRAPARVRATSATTTSARPPGGPRPPRRSSASGRARRPTGWAPREQAMLDAVDELLATATSTDETWARLRAHLDDAAADRARHARRPLRDAGRTAINTLRIQPDG